MEVEVFNTIVFISCYDNDVDTSISIVTKNKEDLYTILNEDFVSTITSEHLPIIESDWKDKESFEWEDDDYYIYKDKESFCIENTSDGYDKYMAEIKPALVNF